MKPSERINFFGTFVYYKEKVKEKTWDLRKTANLNKPAPNPKLLDFTKGNWLNLLDCGGTFGSDFLQLLLTAVHGRVGQAEQAQSEI